MKKGTQKSNSTILRRGLIMLIVFLAACMVLVIRLFFLQVVKYEEYHQKVIENITTETTLRPRHDIRLQHE